MHGVLGGGREASADVLDVQYTGFKLVTRCVPGAIHIEHASPCRLAAPYTAPGSQPQKDIAWK
jgi:hypothetical protein